MIPFIIRRLLQAIPTLIGVSLIAFILLKLAPGDPARILAGKNATPAFLGREAASSCTSTAPILSSTSTS